MKEEINNLRELQEVDLELDKINQEVEKGNAELEELKASIAERQDMINDYQARIEEGSARTKELETQVEEAQTLIKDRQNKLMKVQTNREYQSILKEIEDAKNGNKEREEELVRLLEQAEYLQKKLDEQVAACSEEEETLTAETTRVKKESAKLASQKVKIQKGRDSKAKKIKSDILRKYEQIRERREGLAMVGVSQGVCYGCYMNVPPQLYNELLREDKLHLCPTCNRLLFHLPENDE